MKQSIPKLSEKIEYFPLWEEHFEVFTSMVERMSTFVVDHDIAIGDDTKNTQYFLSQGFSEENTKKARVAWTCLTESIVNRDLLRRVFATKSPTR